MSSQQNLTQTGTVSAVDGRDRLVARLPVTERRVDAAGISTAVLEGGAGPPMVLLHGQGEFCCVWMRVIPDLVTSNRVVVPDLPGHGASEVNGGRLDVDRVLAWLGEVIDQTCDTPPVLVGHLVGGAIAARFAVEHGEAISRLVLVDSLGLAPFRPSRQFAVPMIRFVARPTEKSFQRMFRQCFVDLDGLREDMTDDLPLLESYALDRAQTPGLKAALRALMPRFAMRPIPDESLAAITVPTHLIWGRDDLQVRLDVGEAASARYGWPLHVIDEVGDDPAFERPEAFLDALRSALDEKGNAGDEENA